MEFTYEAYRGLIYALKEAGYHICSYTNYKDYAKSCILRHDVDFDLEQAADFAEFEENIAGGGIFSTYFILISSDFYNVYSAKNIQRIQRIVRAGHHIGLHFDAKRYDREDAGAIKEDILKECRILETMTGYPVQAVSIHRPSVRLLEGEIEIDGIVNCYSRLFFREFKYVSDSRMKWKEDVFGLVHGKGNERLHILTHPIWYGVRQSGMAERLKGFCLFAAAERYGLLDENITSLQDVLQREDIYSITGEGLWSGEGGDWK